MLNYYLWCLRLIILRYWNPMIIQLTELLLVDEPSRLYPMKFSGGFYSWRRVKHFHAAFWKN